MLKADLEVSLAGMNMADYFDKSSVIHINQCNSHIQIDSKTFLKLEDGHGMKVTEMRNLAVLQVTAAQARRAEDEARAQIEQHDAPIVSPGRKRRTKKKKATNTK
jgi:hypothetical protein